MCYREFYWSVRKTLKVSEAKVSDEALRATYNSIAARRCDVANFFGPEAPLSVCLDKGRQLIARQHDLRRKAFLRGKKT